VIHCTSEYQLFSGLALEAMGIGIALSCREIRLSDEQDLILLKMSKGTALKSEVSCLMIPLPSP